ncbi:uncharacterized protein LOC132840286 [Tachysurus vachellii]|uniref:uncharacterized protein LOC132840286 n=1 Tax=Tachysurus vachellii TaxID=175792 RepID=UPI00296B2E37|nr:uncharacterized protein LOC132840286 [Tachysurus vachellii]
MFLSVFSCSVMGLILTSTCVICVGLFSPALALSLHTPDPVTSAPQERLEAPFLHLPVFLHFRNPRVDKQQFSPEHVQSRSPLPKRVRQVLVPAPRRRPKTRTRPNGPVSVVCTSMEMRVRVDTSNLGANKERMHVRLGTCEVSRQTEQTVLFQYELHECGSQRQIVNKTVVYSNMLRYTPDATVLGSETFSVPVQCHFNRFHYSYKIGFVPSVERLKFFKPMKTKGSVSLTACDAQWNRLPPSEAVVIGQPMYFEAETLYVPEDERLYVHFCHITTNSSRVSTPQVNIIYNYGCLMDSKRSNQSRFTSSTRRNIVRFIIDAFTLQGKVQKYMFIHCEMSIRSIIATQTSKLCSYNQLEHRWEELHGADSVCSCCDSSCVPEMPTPMQPLTSKLGTLVEQDPEGPSGKNLGQSTEGIFTPKPEHEILITENLHKTIIPERRLTSEHEHRITLESTSESRTTVLTPEREHGEMAPETPPTPESEHGEMAPETPPTPESENGEMAPETPPTPESENGEMAPETPPTPESEHGEILPETPPTPEREHGEILPETPPTPEREHGEILPETPPTPEGEFIAPTLDTIQEKITRYTHEPLTPSDKNTMSLVDTHTQPLEPYKIFEEVFGLS